MEIYLNFTGRQGIFLKTGDPSMIAIASKPIRKRRQIRARRCTFKNAYTRFFARVQVGPNLYAGYYAQALGMDPMGDKLILGSLWEREYGNVLNMILFCWLCITPTDSFLRTVLNQLSKSYYEWEIVPIGGKNLPSGKVEPPTIRPRYGTGINELVGGTISIDLQASYTVKGTTYSFEQALAHELLHAYYYEQGDLKDHHNIEGFVQGDHKIQAEAAATECVKRLNTLINRRYAVPF